MVKSTIKNILGEMPFTAEMYWRLRQRGKPTGGFSFNKIQDTLPAWRADALEYRKSANPAAGKRIWMFATLRYWIEHAALMGIAFGALGHDVRLAFLPYTNWQKPINRFDLRRQNAFVQDVLGKAVPLYHVESLLDFRFKADLNSLPVEMRPHLEELALQDTQYTHQVEEVNRAGKLYRLRLERNVHAALAALDCMARQRPDVVVLPSGSILEFGAVYQAARHLGIPVVSYEFGEQRQRIWFGLNSPVMRQNTDEMWVQYQDVALTDEQTQTIRELFASRQKANLWQNFARRWQGVPSEGGARVREALHLDERPVVLLAANVIGDSLTLGRQVFTDTMSEWLVRTAQEFARRPQVQLVVRIHPGERYTTGPSVGEIIKQALASYAEMPENVRLIAADAPVNTYDLVEIADLGLVYTTTVGMEMALSGVPVIVIGQTHYRKRGFTLDPNSWEEYTSMLEAVLAHPAQQRLTQEQVQRAWRYAYRFFFDYPQPFPWHLWHFWDDVEHTPLGRVLSEEGLAQFGQTFRYLAGEPRRWS